MYQIRISNNITRVPTLVKDPILYFASFSSIIDYMNVESLLGIVLACAGGLLFYFGFRKSSESNNLSHYVPVDTIGSIPFDVPVVANGTVAADQPLISPVTQKSCVYYQYILERETETKDSKGTSTWEWKTVGSPEVQTTPFYLHDKNGKILIK